MKPEGTPILPPTTPHKQKEEPASAPGRVDVVDDSETKTIDWAGIVARIQNGENAAIEELYCTVARGIRSFLYRQVGPENVDDKVHDTFLLVVQAIQHGDVREPERLVGFIRALLARQIAAYIDQKIHNCLGDNDMELGTRMLDKGRNRERHAVNRGYAAFVKDALEQLPDRDREVLIRLYLREEPEEQICREMGLTDTEFHLAKSRKPKIPSRQIANNKLQRPIPRFFLRTSA